MGDQAPRSTALAEIAAARVKQWSVEFDQGRVSQKPGVQCEAVMKLGPQLVRLSHDGGVTASSANLFKLEPGQERLFASVILLRLADSFRSGNNFIRVCILKVLLMEFRERGRGRGLGSGEWFSGVDNNTAKAAVFGEKPMTSNGSKYYRSRATTTVRRIGSGVADADADAGLLAKKRIENHMEVLRRFKSVIDSGEPTSRALTIRVLGCLADLGKDSRDVHNLVLQAVHSLHYQEVSAALFTMGCLSEVSDEFARLTLQTVSELVNAMGTPPKVKVLAVRLFAKLGHSPALSSQVLEIGRRIMLRYPMHELVTSTLISLTILATDSSVTLGSQVNLLLMYIAHDPRMNVRAVAMKCLGKLVPKALFCSVNSGDDIFNGIFAVMRDTGLPPALHGLALRIIRKLFRHCVVTMEFGRVSEVLAWVELAALFDGAWLVVSQALSLLVDLVCDLGKLKKLRRSEFSSSPPSPSAEDDDDDQTAAEVEDLSIRVCFLLCDQASAVVGSVAGHVRRKSKEEAHLSAESFPAVSTTATVSEEEEDIINFNLQQQQQLKISTVCMLLVRLVKSVPSMGWHVVNNVAGVLEALADYEQKKKNVMTHDHDMEVDHDRGDSSRMEVDTEMTASREPELKGRDPEEFNRVEGKVTGSGAGAGDGPPTPLEGKEQMFIRSESASRRLGLISGSEFEFVCGQLGRCISSVTAVLQEKADLVENVHVRLVRLVNVLMSVGAAVDIHVPPSCLTPVLHALMKVNLVENCLTLMTVRNIISPEGEEAAGAGAPPVLGKSMDDDDRQKEKRLGAEAETKSRRLVESRGMLQNCGTKLLQERSLLMSYEMGKHAAVCGLWDLAESMFDGLADKAASSSSEGCYFWLRAMQDQAKAERILQSGNYSYSFDQGLGDRQQNDEEPINGTGISSQEGRPSGSGSATEGGAMTQSSRDLGRSKAEDPGPEAEDPFGGEVPSRMEEEEPTSSSSSGGGGGGGGGGLDQLSRVAYAIRLFQNSIGSLSAGVCLERMFEFQRCVLTLRMEMIETVFELVGQLAHVVSCGTDARVMDLEDKKNYEHMKRLGSVLEASKERVQLLAYRLKYLSQEYDLLAISFLGIDQDSVGMLSRAALFCSLLTFCTLSVLSPQTTFDPQLSPSPTLNAGSAALDLYNRFHRHMEVGDLDDLLVFAIQSGAGVATGGRAFGGGLLSGPQETALVKLSRWATTSVLAFEDQDGSLITAVRGAALLQEILQRCLQVPWPSAPFFFCTRPRIGVELFVAQAGQQHSNPSGDAEDISVPQGSALALSVCLQIVNAPQESVSLCKRLVSDLSVEQADQSHLKPDDDGDDDEGFMGSKAKFVLNQRLRPPVVEKLIWHSKSGRSPVSGPSPRLEQLDNSSTTYRSVPLKKKGILNPPGLIFFVSVNSKGQGFGSCTLDVSRLSCGEYQLTLSCICVGKSGEQWILPLLSTRPTFRIT